MKDVAELAQVGVATVDRAFNDLAPVSPATAARVLAAAKSLECNAHGLLRRRIEGVSPARTFGFVLKEESKWFHQAVADAQQQAATGLRLVRAKVEIQFVEALSPDDLAGTIIGLTVRVAAIGLVAVDHPKIAAPIAWSARPLALRRIVIVSVAWAWWNGHPSSMAQSAG